MKVSYGHSHYIFFQASYERMLEARKAAFEYFKETGRGVIDSAPQMIYQFGLNEKVRRQI